MLDRSRVSTIYDCGRDHCVNVPLINATEGKGLSVAELEVTSRWMYAKSVQLLVWCLVLFAMLDHCIGTEFTCEAGVILSVRWYVPW